MCKVFDIWFETSTLGLSEKIFDKLAGEKFEANLMGMDGEEHHYGFSHKSIKINFPLPSWLNPA